MPEILSVMKDMASLLEKQDTTQEKAKLAKPPKTGEDQKPITGGTSPNGKPGEGFAKEFVAIPKASPAEGSVEVDSEGGSLLKEDEEAEEGFAESAPREEEETDGMAEDEEGGDIAELKSILKSMAIELANVKKSQGIASKAEIQKMVKAEADHMLRKMGFHPSTPDIVKFGIDQTAEVKKSEDRTVTTDIRKSSVDTLAGKDLSGLSWRELGRLREDTGGFRQF
jgi:hypothetical protein